MKKSIFWNVLTFLMVLFLIYIATCDEAWAEERLNFKVTITVIYDSLNLQEVADLEIAINKWHEGAKFDIRLSEPVKTDTMSFWWGPYFQRADSIFKNQKWNYDEYIILFEGKDKCLKDSNNT